TGKSVGMVKMDPYLQLDAGTMSPYEHGEVFVTQDGGECDLDIGNYERFTDENLGKVNNITTGKVYQNVINKERAGEFLGKTVMLFPHIPNEIKEQILVTASKYDVTVIEVGGTIGDLENAPFLEAIRGLKKELGRNNVLTCVVAPLLHLNYSGEVKTKLIQHAVSDLRKTGVIPDAIICRTEVEMEDDIKEKLALTCDVDRRALIEAKNVETIYQVPEYFAKQGFLDFLGEKLDFDTNNSDLKNWSELVAKITDAPEIVKIGVVGKYTAFEDTYKSINEAFIHAGVANNSQVKLTWIDSENIKSKSDVEKALEGVNGVLIPGGFGDRGVEGKILTVQYLRENNIPFLGICLGLQVAVIEYARNVCGITDAHSAEFSENSKNLVIDFMEEQKDITQKGGTMRLGSYEAKLGKNSLAAKLYGTTNITERHRHRYEVNPDYHDDLESNGLSISGKSPTRDLAEFVEISDHKFFIATQAHPEFKSRLERPHPLFVGLVKASLEK
ncbi:CTP synthase, partial [Candidatus Gracilibacteria bacterium]|nr:CTP synthase [Candidatus Gracilibacteria bacterium]